MSKEDELIQYFVVNSELNMSPGKIAAQVAHVATKIAYYNAQYIDLEWSNDEVTKALARKFTQWYEGEQKKIILKGKEKDLMKLIKNSNNGGLHPIKSEYEDWFYIRDNGYTEIPTGSLTVVGCYPNYKSELQKYVKRLQLL